MNRQSRSTILMLLAGLALGCGDDDDTEPLTDSGVDPSTEQDAGDEDPDPGPGPGNQMDAGLDAAVAMDAALDASRDAQADAAADAGDASLPDGGRLQDTRRFTVDPASLPFEALPNAPAETDRFYGVLDGAGYRIEVPKQWNGILVMYAHGYGGEVPALTVRNPSIRRHLIANGYAWAASSYSTNFYDVRTGVEDTNKLANAFTRIAGQNGRTLAEPTKRYITGHSMGGHVTGAAIEKEALETAANKVRYDGAVPMCGVMGDSELFDYFAAYQLAAEQIAGITGPTPTGPAYEPIRTRMRGLLFSTFPSATMQGVTTPLGDKLRDVVRNLTGGARPFFETGFAGSFQGTVWGTFGGDGTINGILAKPVTNTLDVEYQLDDDPAFSAEERAFNNTVKRVSPAQDANPLRPDGVRWIPRVNGEFDVPVVSLHTLGDLYVPFKMQQIYRQRAETRGSVDNLVQRAIRGISHCDFTNAEQVDAFEAMVAWEQRGEKPEGDDVLTPAVLREPTYGCRFTNNTPSPDDSAAITMTRASLPPCPTGAAPQ